MNSLIINLNMVPGEGLEPSHCYQHRILSPARLPIPPSRHVKFEIIHETGAFIKHKRCSTEFGRDDYVHPLGLFVTVVT